MRKYSPICNPLMTSIDLRLDPVDQPSTTFSCRRALSGCSIVFPFRISCPHTQICASTNEKLPRQSFGLLERGCSAFGSIARWSSCFISVTFASFPTPRACRRIAISISTRLSNVGCIVTCFDGREGQILVAEAGVGEAEAGGHVGVVQRTIHIRPRCMLRPRSSLSHNDSWASREAIKMHNLVRRTRCILRSSERCGY